MAARLGNGPLEEWLVWESNGYPENADVPDYRIWPLEVKGHFSGPFGSGIKNAPIPNAVLPKKIRDDYLKYKCRQSIANIEILLRKSDTGSLVEVNTGDLALALGQKVYSNQNCIQAWAVFSTMSLVEVINSVRNRVLDFALAVWKEEPKAGDLSAQKLQMDAGRITQIFNMTIHGGYANVVGAADNSTIEFNIGAGDFEALRKALSATGVGSEDIKSLQTALQTDPRPKAVGLYGPAVANWIAQMTKKAAIGTWRIAVNIATAVLTKAIEKYYGLS